MSPNLKSVIQTLLVAILGSVIGILCVTGAKQFMLKKESNVIPRHGDFASVIASVDVGINTPVLITRTGCPACKRAKEWLAKNNIPVRIIVSDKQAEISDLLMDKTEITAVPAIITKSQIIVGFDEQVWDNAKLK